MRTPAQQGFTLVEVLVTLVIFAFGMLGVAGLQITSLAGMDSAQYRSVAALKAGEMAERIRANPAGAYAGAAGADRSCRTSHYADGHAAPSACAPDTMAEDDLWDWQQELTGRMPGGSGAVCLDSTPDDGSPGAPACDGSGGVLAIKVWWTDKQKSAAAPAPKRIVLSLVK